MSPRTPPAPRTPRPRRRTARVAPALALTTILGLGLGLVACGSSDGDGATPATTAKATTTSTSQGDEGTTTPAQQADTPSRDDLYGVRYCEVLLLRSTDGEFSAEVWNTLGENDCPQAEWAKLDAAAIKTERGAIAAILNGPRYWVLDSITSNIRKGAPETTFGSLGMFQAAVIDFGNEAPSQTPYIERSIVRETVFGFEEGREVYELTAPDGTTYVMQAYSQIKDASLTAEDLPDLDARIDQPEGWTYAARTLTEDLELLSTDGVATVLQDELQNTYQRVDET